MHDARLPVPPKQIQFALPERVRLDGTHRPGDLSVVVEIQTHLRPEIAERSIKEQADVLEGLEVGRRRRVGRKQVVGILKQSLVSMQGEIKFSRVARPEKRNGIAGIGAEIQSAAKDLARKALRLFFERFGLRSEGNAPIVDAVIRFLIFQHRAGCAW